MTTRKIVTIAQCIKLSTAQNINDMYPKASVIVMGDNGRFWVVNLTNAQLCKNAGLELLPKS